MPTFNNAQDVADTMSAPLGQLIASVGTGLSEAQQALDRQAIATIRAMHEGQDKSLALLKELGYQPSWYKIPEVEAEIIVSLSIGGESSESGQAAQGGAGSKMNIYATTMDASYTNKYEYDLKAASRVKFKIVPVPPTAGLESVLLVPMLIDLTFVDARALLENAGIEYEFGPVEPADVSRVKSATPGAGELIAPGKKVLLEF